MSDDSRAWLKDQAGRLDRCMLADRRVLDPMLGRIRRRIDKGRPVGREIRAFEELAQRSGRRFEQRLACRPVVSYPISLPVSDRREEIAAAIAEHQVIVLCGETGSGKTTQVPKICLELGRGIAGQIGHTQPRRIAARAIAERIAEELGQKTGEAIGFKVRFSDRSGPESLVKVMTDGILLAEIRRDRRLEAYDTLVIDEAHERSLNIDFLLGYLHQLLPRRPDLKLIITSATIDTEKFSRHFWDAPVIEVSGRTYPVELRYEDPQARAGGETVELVEAIARAIDTLPREDTLVFLPGERDIRDAAEVLTRRELQNTEILPLYARLSTSEQQRIFHPAGARRIVLATNVAETSLTVPGIRYVIDSGLARVSRYSYRSKIQRLPIEKISRASAAQRAGRCGRLADGVCIRLYDEEDFEARQEHTDPQILRTNLASVILQMQTLGLGDIETFPFVDAPDGRFIRDGYRLLRELQAVDVRGRVTKLGRQIARFPVDPTLARMLIAAGRLGCLREVLVIVAGLSIQDPRERPAEKADKADARHQSFADENSDFVALLNLWQAWQERRKEVGGSRLRRWCREHFLAFMRMREWQDVHQQLAQLAQEMGLTGSRHPADYETIHRALLSGLLGHVGTLDEQRVYLGARASRFMIFPGSGLGKRTPKWIMAAVLMETTRVYARTAAAIQPEWVEEAAAHLVNRRYSEPRWEAKAGRVAALESVTLYGLTLSSGRKVNYGPINPGEAREMFIREALVQGRSRLREKFLVSNRALVARLEEIEARYRSRGAVFDEQKVYDFYARRMPGDVWDLPTFERWWRGAGRGNPALLTMAEADLLRTPDAASVDQVLYPSRMELPGTTLELSYHFEPGEDTDGVTVHVPLPLLEQLPAERMSWLVPGLLEQRITALLRALPKSLRRNFVPVPEFAAACIENLGEARGALTDALSGELLRMTGVTVPPEAWNERGLPAHLRMRFQVEDEAGKTLAGGRDLQALRSSLAGTPRRIKVPEKQSQWQRCGIRSWDFGALPPFVEVTHGARSMRVFPAIRDRGRSVDLELVESEAAARRISHDGVRRLFILKLGREVGKLEKYVEASRALALIFSRLQDDEPPSRDFVRGVFDAVFLRDDDDDIRSDRDFEARLQRRKARLFGVAQESAEWLSKAMESYGSLQRTMGDLQGQGYAESLDDVHEQLALMIHPGFLRTTPLARLPDIGRYLDAVAIRLEKLLQDPRRDYRWMGEIRPFWLAWQQAEAADAELCRRPEAQDYRWAMEEFRVSLFAQQLRTAGPVSAKRLRKLWQGVEALFVARGKLAAGQHLATP